MSASKSLCATTQEESLRIFQEYGIIYKTCGDSSIELKIFTIEC